MKKTNQSRLELLIELDREGVLDRVGGTPEQVSEFAADNRDRLCKAIDDLIGRYCEAAPKPPPKKKAPDPSIRASKNHSISLNQSLTVSSSLTTSSGANAQQ